MTLTKTETTENNKLIAEFMGETSNTYYVAGVDEFGDVVWSKELLYNTSWDWLMPVVDKIEKQGCIIEIWMSLATGCRIMEVSREVKSWTTTMEHNEPIMAVYIAVIEFIKWHNSKL